MFNLYRKSKAAERAWIRKHPVMYVALNVTVFAALIGYLEYKDRKDMREIEDNFAHHAA